MIDEAGNIKKPTPEQMLAVAEKIRESLPNQCDGCRRGLPVDHMNIHREADGWPYMVCDADRYVNNQDEEREFGSGNLRTEDELANREAELLKQIKNLLQGEAE